MLDIKFIRENQDLIKKAAEKKHIKFDLERLISVDDKRRELLSAAESKRAEQNQASEKIAAAGDDAERRSYIEAVTLVKGELQKVEEDLKEVMIEWQKLMVEVPNIPDVSVPDGQSDRDNVELRTWGEKPQFDFDIKSHISLMKELDLVDFERGAKVAGFRGYFLKNDAVALSFAVEQFVFSHFLSKGFIPMIVPALVKRGPFIGTGYLPQSEEDLYKTQDGDFLAGTGEVATMSYYMDEIVDIGKLPVKLFSYSPCYRREAGSHGKDTKGLVRVHEFTKFEQVILCEARHETSVALHEEITKNAEEVMQALGLHYRIVTNCGADLGLGQVKKYDIEAWVPSENAYRETHSASYFHDFQTRRLNIRYRDTDGKPKFVHSLNNTAIATPRILVPMIENYQSADGSVSIPETLRPFMAGKERITKPV